MEHDAALTAQLTLHRLNTLLDQNEKLVDQNKHLVNLFHACFPEKIAAISPPNETSVEKSRRRAVVRGDAPIGGKRYVQDNMEEELEENNGGRSRRKQKQTHKKKSYVVDDNAGIG